MCKDHEQGPWAMMMSKDHEQRPWAKIMSKDHEQRPREKAMSKDQEQSNVNTDVMWWINYAQESYLWVSNLLNCWEKSWHHCE